MTGSPTIFALASAPGRGGVAVFRVSGPDARMVFEKLCRPSAIPKPREAMLRKIHHPQTGELIDQALTLFFPMPNSFTGEDVVEIHAHGGRAVTNAVIESLRALPGFRLAEPGEFTRRAFENGKFDLTEAEAIADLVNAETEAQRRQALRQMEGELGRLYESWRARLLKALAYFEAAIDFSDEDLPRDVTDKQTQELRALTDEIARHLDDRHRGERLREGFSIAILGPPNAGKSRLLNALAWREAAIVSSTAGTTRDVIEVHLDIGGYAVILADTAGLRESADAIESEGVRRALQRAERADLRLLVFDGAHYPQLDAATQKLAGENAIAVVNKADLFVKKNSPSPPTRGRRVGMRGDNEFLNPHSTLTPTPLPPQEGEGVHHYAEMPLFISAKTGEGIPALLDRLIHEIDMRFADTGAPTLTHARYRAALENCVSHLQRALTAKETELRAEDMRLAMRELGRITGRVDVEDLLDIIFRDFCIGK